MLRRHRLAFVLGSLAFVAMAVYWTLIFTGSFNWRNPDKLHDATWVARAARICAPVERYINALPRAQTARTPDERATTVDQGSDKLATMIEELGATPPDNASDRDVVTAWLSDWKVYVSDRRDFTRRLRLDPKAEPLFTEVHGGWATNSIDAFADANDLVACSSPQDL